MARRDYIKPKTIITGFRKAGTWPIDPSAIPFVKEHLDAEERRRLDSPSTRSSSLYPPSSSHPLNTSAIQLPLTPNRRRTHVIAISKAFEERENVQPDDDLTTSNAIIAVLRDQVERDQVQIAHSAVRKKQIDRENGTSEAEVGDRIVLKNPEHGGVIFTQESAILQGTLRTAALIKKNARKGVVGGGVGKKGGKGRGERSFGKEMVSRAGRTGGRVRGGVRGGGRRKARALLEESSSDSSMDVEEEENEEEEEKEEVLSRAVVRMVPQAAGVKKRVGREKKDLSRFWTYKWVPRVEDETTEEPTNEGAGGSVEVMGHRLRAK